MEKTITWSARKPRSSRFRLLRLRANNPAPTSSAVVRTICETTSAFRKRTLDRPPETPDPCSLKVASRFRRVARAAGATPNKRPVRAESARVKPSKRGLSSVERPSAPTLGGIAATNPWIVQTATINPTIPPIIFLVEDAPQCRAHTEDFKIVAGDQLAVRALGLPGARDAQRNWEPRQQPRKGVVAIAQVLVHRIRE